MVVTANIPVKLNQDREHALILWFEDVDMSDVSLVGEKNASLGEMIQQLKPPETAQSQKTAHVLHTYHLDEKLLLDTPVLTTGRAVGKKSKQVSINKSIPRAEYCPALILI